MTEIEKLQKRGLLSQMHCAQLAGILDVIDAAGGSVVGYALTEPAVRVEIVIGDRPSPLGLDDGRIHKLRIARQSPNGRLLADLFFYDRGEEMAPVNESTRQLVYAIQAAINPDRTF